MDNFTMSGFLLVGFSTKPELELIHASLFLVLYMVALTGNLLIITATSMNNSLHSPMYFFLKHLSFLDLCYISVTVSRSIYISIMHSGYISLWECIVQCFAFTLCGNAELSMLTVMSYDRYVAICLPLHYEIIMDVSTCVHGVLGVWISGVISGAMHTAATFSMHFCVSHVIHQFFCDIPQLLKLSCSNEYIREVGVSAFLCLIAFLCIVFIGLSYTQIFSTVLRMPSAKGRAKAFSTCLPHLAVMILFISAGSFEYLKPPSDSPSALDIFLTVMYTVVPPALNPVIYSLKNQAMKAALRKAFQRPEIEILLASLFLILYMVAVSGNILIITTTSMDNSLHSPMYFFLKHLSFLDLCYISVTVPRAIYNSFTQSGYISLGECIVQCFAFVLCGSAELSMLTLMSYDRYVAICFPLRYEIIMDVSTCLQGVVGVWISGVISGTMHTAATFSMHFCVSHVIHQFFCDIPQLLKLSCSNEYISDTGVSGFIALVAFLCITFIGMSYTKIFSTVLKMPSAEGRAKAFSTCLPHLAVVILFISTSVFEFLKPPSDSPSALDILLTIMYTVVPPTLNPMIYNLRNKAIKLRRNMANFTLSGFLLVGFSTKPEIEILLASLFLILYMVAVSGNILIITTTSMDNSLHSPMYFFLKHLSFLDLCYISVTVPRAIYNSFTQSGYISLGECIVQCFAFVLCGSAELSMLTLMSYDRYVAICFPLRYEIIMDVSTCLQGVVGVWISGVISGTMHTAATFSMHFCVSHVIHQFFCDIPQLLKLSCSNEYISDTGVSGFIALVAFLCITFIGMSYTKIFSTVLKMPSAEGRAKAFSTCLPHLAVVILFISTSVFEFLKPPSDSPSALDILLTIMYTVVPPTLSPVIYSLRNQAMKAALRKAFQRGNTFIDSHLLLNKPELELFLASLFLVLYLVALTGNILIITTTSMDHSLHSPMYFFLKHLSFLDLCYISVTVPRAIYNTFMHSGYISLGECIVQCFAFIVFAASELFMLTVMSYDRYVVICLPLRYEIIMDVRTCVHGVVGVWISGVISGTMHTAATFSMHFCVSHVIHQFFCDIPQLLKLSYSNEYVSDIGVTAFLSFMTFLCVAFIGHSYFKIFTTVQRMPSAEGRAKAFSTCLPHLAVVILFISTSIFEFLKPPSDSPSALDIFLTIMYAKLPMFPFCLANNTEMKCDGYVKECGDFTVRGFLLLGFSAKPELHPCFSVLALTGNILIITATSMDNSLHSPMYFFFKHLSFLDLCYISVTVPRSINNPFMQNGYISLWEYIVQCFALVLCSSAELLMLTVMPSVAICLPVPYEVINGYQHLCPRSLDQWCNFWNQEHIWHFLHEFLWFPYHSLVLLYSLVLRVPFVEGGGKAIPLAFPTLLWSFISMSFFEFLKASSNSPSVLDTFLTIMYTVVSPTLNPMIYSLRSQAIIAARRKSGYISLEECIVQCFGFTFCAEDELGMLTVMSYDHYMATCLPLRYEIIMDVLGVWIIGVISGAMHTAATFSIHFCGSHIIHQFFYDIPQLLKLSCFNEYITDVGISALISFVTCLSVIFIGHSYIQIFSTVLRMPSAEGRAKVFSTCLPHLSVIILFILTKFLKPPSDSPSALDIFLTIMYTVVPPTLNPMIYSLRNQAMKAALRKKLNKKFPMVSFCLTANITGKLRRIMANFTLSGFLLMGFSDKPELELLFASLFIVLYLVTLTGNILITTISIDSSLHSPMYFFLKHLSFLDLCYVSVTVPSGYISLGECIVQCFAFVLCACAELSMLTVMSYDRYVAICFPLCYEIIMDVSKCVHSVLGVWIGGVISGTMHTAATFSMHFCGSHVIHQFFCDIPQLLKLSCSNEYNSEAGVTEFLGLLGFLCFTCIALSYTKIFSTVLRMPSAEGRTKASSTCLSHLIVLILFISTSAFDALDIFLTIMYTIVPPKLNPMIYSLRNQAIKAAV
ncbi:Olfactory receptor 14J1, partial [Galemys pyrenaicus]